MSDLGDRAVARIEIQRINSVLIEPHLLIGGLAVHQYIPTRMSQDVDLVCQFEVANKILLELYPSDEWDLYNSTNDDYRPSFKISHRFEERGSIIFGPKLLEREPYKFIDWNILMKDGKKFKFHGESELDNIIIPSAHALAYTKLISFIGRSGENSKKVEQDLRDFINLTNHRDFSISTFYDLLRKTGSDQLLMKAFREKSSIYTSIILHSSLSYLSNLFISSPLIDNSSSNITVYLAGPHKQVQKNNKVATYLRANGISVRVPYDEVVAKRLKEKKENAKELRTVCMDAIKGSNFVVVDLDTYGLDTAWELGYAEGLRKNILGYNENIELATETRTYQRRLYDFNFMHGWTNQTIFHSIADAAKHCTGKIVYVAGSFANSEIDKIPDSELEKSSMKLIFPKEFFYFNQKLPNDHPFSTRKENIKYLQSAEIILVVLPRYGMDVSWQIGYSTALGKEVVGLMLSDDRIASNNQSFWDHWMHGWKEKMRVTNFKQLTSVIKGIAENS